MMVNTFLPEPDFAHSAWILDYRRLGKQRVETKQILRALRGETKGWQNHPATRMWRGYEPMLAQYGIVICEEWVGRGYKDSLLPYFKALEAEYEESETPLILPHWHGGDIHRSHQSNLIRKYPEHYGSFYPDVPDDLPYLWPV